jgi:hypothetical protein
MVLGRIMAFRLMMIATRLMRMKRVRMKRVWMKRCAYCLVVNEIIGLLISFG